MRRMKEYGNISGTSTVKAVATEHDSITIEFVNGEIYQYNYGSAGKHHVETMKLLAEAGWGLGSYINEVVKLGYAKQLT